MCRERRLVVEVDGSRHAESDHDRSRDEHMRQQGLSVLRFWNTDVLKETTSVCETILAALEGRLSEETVSSDMRIRHGQEWRWKGTYLKTDVDPLTGSLREPPLPHCNRGEEPRPRFRRLDDGLRGKTLVALGALGGRFATSRRFCSSSPASAIGSGSSRRSASSGCSAWWPALAVTALLLAAAGFFQLWNFGDRGGYSAARAVLVALAVLAPFWCRPGVSTPARSSTTFRPTLPTRRRLSAARRLRTAEMNPVAPISAAHGALQAESYPDITGRRYPLSADRVQELAASLVLAHGWVFTDPADAIDSPVATALSRRWQRRRSWPAHRRRDQDHGRRRHLLCRHALGLALRQPRPRRQRRADPRLPAGARRRSRGRGRHAARRRATAGGRTAACYRCPCADGAAGRINLPELGGYRNDVCPARSAYAASIDGSPSASTRPRATRSSRWASTESAAAPCSRGSVSR